MRAEGTQKEGWDTRKEEEEEGEKCSGRGKGRIKERRGGRERGVYRYYIYTQVHVMLNISVQLHVYHNVFNAAINAYVHVHVHTCTCSPSVAKTWPRPSTAPFSWSEGMTADLYVHVCTWRGTCRICSSHVSHDFPTHVSTCVYAYTVLLEAMSTS